MKDTHQYFDSCFSSLKLTAKRFVLSDGVSVHARLPSSSGTVLPVFVENVRAPKPKLVNFFGKLTIHSSRFEDVDLKINTSKNS